MMNKSRREDILLSFPASDDFGDDIVTNSQMRDAAAIADCAMRGKKRWPTFAIY